MDLLNQLEHKIQALVAQRDQLRDDLESAKANQAGHEAKIQELLLAVEGLRSKNAALAEERTEIAEQIESILQQLEAQA